MTKNIMFLKQCIRYVNHFLSLPILPTKENTHKKTPKKLPISGILSVSIFLETFHPSITIWTYCSFSRLHWSGYLKISFSLLWWVSCFLHHMVSSFLLYSIVLVKQTFYYFLIKESINVIFLRPCISENIFILPILNNSFHWIWPNSALEINFSPTTKGLVLWFSTFQCCQWEVWNHYVAILILNPLYVTYFFFLQSILEFLSVVWNFIICIGVGQNNLKSFNSGLLSCIISLVISSPSIFSVLKLTKPLKLTP